MFWLMLCLSKCAKGEVKSSPHTIKGGIVVLKYVTVKEIIASFIFVILGYVLILGAIVVLG